MEAELNTNFPSLLVVDDFMPEPARVRAELLAGKFQTETGPDGGQYTNINAVERPDLHALIERAVGFPIHPLLSFARADLAGERPHSAVHSDTICSEFAVVLYLNPPAQCDGGTAFWTHRYLGIDAMPTWKEVEARSWDPNRFYKSIREDWNQLGLWTMSGYVGMKFNRCVLYPCKMFHSRWPQESFGQDAATGRLVWVCFFNRAAAPAAP